MRRTGVVAIVLIGTGTLLDLQGSRALQIQEAQVQFEVASLRRNVSGDTPAFNASTRVTPGGRVVGTNLTLRELVRDAYGFQRLSLRHVVGGPDWIESERYDIEAKAEREFSTFWADGVLPSDAAAMLRSLLVERFNVQVRQELTEQPVYRLVVRDRSGRLGAGLTAADGTCAGPYAAVPPPPPPGEPAAERLPPCIFYFGGAKGAEIGGVSMDEFAGFLSVFPVIDRFVINETGLTGRWNVKLGTWRTAFRQDASGQLVANEVDGDRPLLPGAVERDLGLRLQSGTGPVPTLIIVSAERPSGN